MDWSDDVAYSTHDFYDFALAGLIPVPALKAADATTLRELLQGYPQLRDASDEAFNLVAQSFQMLPEPALGSTSRLTSPRVGMLKEWVSFQIGRFAGGMLEFRKTANGITLDKKGTIVEEVSILKLLTYHFAIGAPALAIRREGERRILTTLFQVLDQSAKNDAGLMSEDARNCIDKGEHPTRVILDVLSSMTDAQAVSMYHKLTGIEPVSILDSTTLSTL